MIFPEIFDGHVMGFFTDRELGLNISGLTGRKVYIPKQEHTDKIIVVGKDLKQRAGDAVLTERHDILLGVTTADCVPILVYDKAVLVVGAIHAGWRGTAKGILKKTIEKMKKKYGSRPEDILISLGPSIRWCCYEVGEDVLKAVEKATGKGEYHKKQDGKICLDLQTANKVQAASVGVPEQNISMIEECTFCYPERYYSYRYNKKTKGRQGGFIGLP